MRAARSLVDADHRRLVRPSDSWREPAAVDGLDDAATHLDATQAQPQPQVADAVGQPKSFVVSGDPNVRQLETSVPV
jgi:hypothetical protein